MSKSTPSASQASALLPAWPPTRKLVMVDDDLRSRLRPRLGWSEDQVDIDVADHRKRPHHSLRVILVERTGVPAFSTRASAKAIMRRCATGSMAKIAAMSEAGSNGIVLAPATGASPEESKMTTRRAGLDDGHGHRGHQPRRVILPAKEHDADLRPKHLHRSMTKLAAFERKAGAARQFGKAKRQCFRKALQTAAGGDDG